MLSLAALGLLSSAPIGLASSVIPMEHLKEFVAREEPWDQFCNYWQLDDSDPSIATDLWINSGTGAWFDQWLTDHPDHDLWTKVMDQEVNNNGQSGFACATLESECNAPADCKFHFDQGMGWAYWVLLSASRLHDAMEHMGEQLQNEAIYTSLSLDVMIANFEGQEPTGDENIFANLAASMTIASGLSAGAAPISGPFAILGGIFGLLANSQEEPPSPELGLRTQIAESFVRAQGSLADFVKVAFGGDTDTPESALPGQIGGYANPLAGFLAEGKFLVEDIQSMVDGVLENYIQVQQHSICAYMANFYNFVVVVDTTTHTQERCMGMNSAYWEEATGRCFQTMRNAAAGGSQLPLAVDDWTMTISINDYGLDLADFYENAWLCADANPQGGGKVSSDFNTYPTDGSKPTCFYGVPLVEGDATWTDHGYLYITNLGLNSALIQDQAPPPNYPDARD